MSGHLGPYYQDFVDFAITTSLFLPLMLQSAALECTAAALREERRKRAEEVLAVSKQHSAGITGVKLSQGVLILLEIWWTCVLCVPFWCLTQLQRPYQVS